jgi:hypothetical protein
MLVFEAKPKGVLQGADNFSKFSSEETHPSERGILPIPEIAPIEDREAFSDSHPQRIANKAKDLPVWQVF